MRDEDRGIIRNREKKKQLCTFENLRFGKITPTDLDAYLEFKDKVFVFVEIKTGMAQMPRGQEMALVRLHKAIADSKPDKYCVLLVGRHDHQDDEDIDVGMVPVHETWIQGKKFNLNGSLTVRECILRVLDRNNISA